MRDASDDAVAMPGLSRAAAIGWRLLVVAAAAAVVVLVLVELRLVVLPVIAAILVATVLHPLVHALCARGVPRLLATWLTMLGAAGVLAGTVALIVPQVADEWESVDLSVDEGLQKVAGWLEPLGVSESTVAGLPDRARDWLAENGAGLSGQAVSGLTLAVEVVAGALLALVLLFFFLKDGARIWAWLVALLPSGAREHVDEGGQRAWRSIGAYVRGTALVALVDAVLIGIAIAVLGVPLVLPLALLTFVGAFFPLIGAVLAGAVAALVALVAVGVTEALILVAVIIVIQQLEGDLLQPVLLGRVVRLHPVAILLSLTAGTAVAGIVGAFLAVPAAAVASTLLSYARETREPEAAAPVSPPDGRSG